MKHFLFLLYIAFASVASAQVTIPWEDVTKPVAISTLGTLTPAANRIPYYVDGSTGGLITIGGNLSLSGGTLNLSAAPNIGVATGTSLVLANNLTTGGRVLVNGLANGSTTSVQLQNSGSNIGILASRGAIDAGNAAELGLYAHTGPITLWPSGALGATFNSSGQTLVGNLTVGGGSVTGGSSLSFATTQGDSNALGAWRFLNGNATTVGRYTSIIVGKDGSPGGAAEFGGRSDTSTPVNSYAYVANYGDNQDTQSVKVLKGGNVVIGQNLVVNGLGNHTFSGRVVHLVNGLTTPAIQFTDTNTNGRTWLWGPGVATGNVADFTLYDSTGAMQVIRFSPGSTNVTGTLTVSGTTNLAGNGNPIKGTIVNDNAATGYVGEYLSSTVIQGSAVALTHATGASVASLTLTAGDWDVEGLGSFVGGAGVVVVQAATSISTSNNGMDTPKATIVNDALSGVLAASFPTTRMRFSFSSTTTVYLVSIGYFSGGTLSAYGFLSARRVR